MIAQDTKSTATPIAITPQHSVPPEYARNRVLDSQQAADFLGISLPHFRRQYRLGRVPKPIHITERKLGWPAGLLIDFVVERTAAREAA